MSRTLHPGGRKGRTIQTHIVVVAVPGVRDYGLRLPTPRRAGITNHGGSQGGGSSSNSFPLRTCQFTFGLLHTLPLATVKERLIVGAFGADGLGLQAAN